MGIKSYFAPGQKNEDEKKGHDKKPLGTVDLKTLPPAKLGAAQGAPAPTPMSGLTTPKSPYGSRPGSLYSNHRASYFPQGDFRNNADNLADVKADVMCSWLYQSQLERQFATGMLPGEGVVLKKGKNNFACCPPQLRDIRNGLYESAMELNVRVSYSLSALP